VPAFPQVFAVWREADAQARAVEGAVLGASLLALDGLGQPPSVEQQQRARELRRIADALLQSALLEMTVQAEDRSAEPPTAWSRSSVREAA
jgi:hypothetical protein